MKILNSLAEAINDPRDSRYVKHTIIDMMTQHVSQIAAGYENDADCDTLLSDPISKMFANRLPNIDDDLASQLTLKF
ncbi:MAG: transposase [bacterium]|nr:MAG: transposase [bacterium]